MVAVGALGLGAKTVEHGQLAVWGDLKDDTLTMSSAYCCCPIEIPVSGLNKPGVRSAALLESEAVEQGVRAARSDFEDRPVKRGSDSASRSSAVEVSVGG